MHIVSVVIENYRAISNVEIPFTDSSGRPRPVSVIVGPNGCGKTSILFAIMQALRGVIGFRTTDVPEPSRDDIRLPASALTGWADRPPDSSVRVELQFSREEQETIPRVMELLGKKAPPPLPDGRLQVRWKYPPGFDRDGTRRESWFADISPPLENVRAWLFAKSSAIQERNRDLVSRIGGLEFFPQDRNLLLRVVGNKSGRAPWERIPAETEMHEDEGETDRPGRHDRTVSEILESLADFAADHPGLPDLENRERQIQTIFDRVCFPKKYAGVKYRDGIGAPVLQDGSHIYPLSNAASGEQVILEYITRLVYRGRIQHSVILIDEPEVHLHPKWVRQLYLALPQIGKDNQFILTTHSDELRRRASADNSVIELGSLGVEE
jgi:energy-coupling factor transporter ATP-binding protein EcfA2